MSEALVHNYAFRKALGYVGNKRGRGGSEEVRQTYENATHQKISTKSPYLPSYMPIKSFVILLQIIMNSLGDKKAINSGKRTHRCYDVGFYLYTGPSEKDSPYHYLDPHKPLSDVLNEFYHNLKTPSAFFKHCETELVTQGSTITITWKGFEEYIELFFYLEGMHAGMIKESVSEASMMAKKAKDTFLYEIELLK